MRIQKPLYELPIICPLSCVYRLFPHFFFFCVVIFSLLPGVFFVSSFFVSHLFFRGVYSVSIDRSRIIYPVPCVRIIYHLIVALCAGYLTRDKGQGTRDKGQGAFE